MGFKNNDDGTRTYTSSDGKLSYTRDSHGNLTSRTTNYNSGWSQTTTYSNGKITGKSNTFNKDDE